MALNLAGGRSPRLTVSAPAPLAWRNLTADRRRLARSVAGVGFAVLLMMLQLGFRDGYIESMLLMMRELDGDIMLVNSQMYQFERAMSFPRRQLAAARATPGVASARPFYIERTRGVWRNPRNGRRYAVPVFAFDPDKPVLSLPAVATHLEALREPGAIMVDRTARDNIEAAEPGARTELAQRDVRIVGAYRLGPNFFNDGGVVTSDRTFFMLFGGAGAGEPPDPQVGVLKALPGHDVGALLGKLRQWAPAGVTVLSKQEFLDQEADLHARYSPVGPVFDAGALVGFVVGMLISYQILFTEISDQLPQYATLKAIGYSSAYLARVVIQQAVFYALVAYAPAWLLCAALLRLVAYLTVSPAHLTLSLTVTTLGLTLAMCVASGLVAMRNLVRADPAETF